MSARFWGKVPHRSVELQVGPLHRLSDLTVTVAQVDATELYGSRITITGQKPSEGTVVAKDLGENKDIFVYEDGNNITGYVHIKGPVPVEFSFPTTFFWETTCSALKAATSSGEPTVVLDYSSTFPSTQTGHDFRDDHYHIFLSGITNYIDAANSGRAAVPFGEIVIAMDEAAYAMYQQSEGARASEEQCLRVDSPVKRLIQHERQLLEQIHLDMGDIDGWLKYPQMNDTVQKAIIVYLSLNRSARRTIEDWPEFNENPCDGNYVSALYVRARRYGWSDLIKSFLDRTLNAAKLLDYVQVVAEPIPASAIKNRLLFIATSDPG